MDQLNLMNSEPSILLSGSNGTIGQPLKISLEKNNYRVISWDRKQIPVDHYQQMYDFIRSSKAKIFIHLAAITSFDEKQRNGSWLVNVEWPSEIAWICKELNIKFIFISTNLVFESNGPYTLEAVPDAQSGYGFEKRIAEERVMQQNKDTVILRLGWQIAEKGSNSMLSFLEQTMAEKLKIEASQLWFPSCSWVEDTVKVIMSAIYFKPGIYMFNANINHSFYDIVTYLKEFYHRNWVVEPSRHFQADQRMFDERTLIKDIRLFQ